MGLAPAGVNFRSTHPKGKGADAFVGQCVLPDACSRVPHPSSYVPAWTLPNKRGSHPPTGAQWIDSLIEQVLIPLLGLAGFAQQGLCVAEDLPRPYHSRKSDDYGGSLSVSWLALRCGPGG